MIFAYRTMPAILVGVALLAVSAGAEDVITATGSTTLQPVIEKAAAKFQETHAGVKIEVKGGGSSLGVKDVGEGKTLLGMVSRDLKKEEREKFADLEPVRIAQDGIALIVHKDNPLTGLSKRQVQDIYGGKIASWKELGGGDAPIALVGKTEGHSTLELFLLFFELEVKPIAEGEVQAMVHRVKGSEAYATVKAKLIGPNADAIQSVTQSPTAIAYVSIGTAQKAVQDGLPIKLLDLDGVAATVEHVATGAYPLRRPLLLVTKGKPTGVLAEFLAFLRGADGRKIIQELDFIPAE